MNELSEATAKYQKDFRNFFSNVSSIEIRETADPEVVEAIVKAISDINHIGRKRNVKKL